MFVEYFLLAKFSIYTVFYLQKPWKVTVNMPIFTNGERKAWDIVNGLPKVTVSVK
jgi:hypothetical protein